jgi:hypothetical protein
MGNPNQVFLLLSHDASKRIVKEYRGIRKATEGIGTAVFLHHARHNNIPIRLKEHSHYLFSDESLSALGYPVTGSWTFAHAYFPLLQFFRDNPDFDYYWVIEYDVRFSGDWRFFFEFFIPIDGDFLTCHIRTHADEPDWFFWPLHHPEKSIPISERLRSFNTIYRVSKSSLFFLDHALRDGWCGHQEVLIPTLLYHNGFTIKDFGGTGSFTPQGMENRFYTSPESDGRGGLTSGTMRFRPCHWRVGLQRNKLYHPIKPLAVTVRENMRNLGIYRRLKRVSRKFRRVLRKFKRYSARKFRRLSELILEVARNFHIFFR